MQQKIAAMHARRLGEALERVQREIEPLEYLLRYAPLDASEARRQMAAALVAGDGAGYAEILARYTARNARLRDEHEREEKEREANRASLRALYDQVCDTTRIVYGARGIESAAKGEGGEDAFPPYAGLFIWPRHDLVRSGTIAEYFKANLDKIYRETVNKPPDQWLELPGGSARLPIHDYLRDLRTFKRMALQILSDALAVADL
ncbi:MAG: hypothetical protein QW587_08985, partial [Candidatus Bathyarchaeia archaeon]